MSLPNVSSDLIWEVVRTQNAYLVKNKKHGVIQMSRDPLNLTNVHSRKYAGFVNEKAVGVVPNADGGVTVISKTKAANKPVKVHHVSRQGANKSARKTYKSVAALTAKSGYRADLREAAVARVSALRHAQLPVKADPEPKLRGKKAE